MTLSRPRLLGGIWLAAVVVIVASSVAMNATLSTIAFVLAICAVPMGIMLVIGLGAATPTVAEVLYAVNKDGRS